MASAASAGQGNGLIVLLGVSTDGTIQIQSMPSAPVAVAMLPPPVPPKGLPPPPAPPVRPPCPHPSVVGVVDVFTCLNVRTGPSTSFHILGTLQPGAAVNIVGSRDGWYEIIWHGRKAWICGYYVWRPGKPVRNGDIRSHIRNLFGAQALPPEPRERREPPSGGGGGGGSAGRHRSDGGLDIPLHNQNSIGAKYPSGFCGPTSLKMVLGYYGKDRDINFLGLSDVGGATPVYNKGVGAGHQAMLDMLRHCGLKGSYMTHAKSIAWLREQTAAGRPVIVSVAGNYGAGFTTAGHILVVSGVTSDGRIILNDSAGGKRRIVSGSQFLGAWSSSNRMAIVAQP